MYREADYIYIALFNLTGHLLKYIVTQTALAGIVLLNYRKALTNIRFLFYFLVVMPWPFWIDRRLKIP